MILLSTEKTQVNQLEATRNNMHRREEASYKIKIQEPTVFKNICISNSWIKQSMPNDDNKNLKPRN